MKHIRVIDGAENCRFSIRLISDEDFAAVFAEPGRDVEFIEDLTARVGEMEAGALVSRSTTRRIAKRDAVGIHGTLFFGPSNRRRFFPTKRETDVDADLSRWAAT